MLSWLLESPVSPRRGLDILPCLRNKAPAALLVPREQHDVYVLQRAVTRDLSLVLDDDDLCLDEGHRAIASTLRGSARRSGTGERRQREAGQQWFVT